MPHFVRAIPGRRTAALLLALPAFALAGATPASALATGTISVNSAALNDVGQAVVSLTYTCAEGTDVLDTPPQGLAQVEQNSRGVVGNQTFTALCDNKPHTTTVRINAADRAGHDTDFTPGTAYVSAFLIQYDFHNDAFTNIASHDRTLTLS